MMILSGLLTFLIFLSTFSTASGLGSVLSREWHHLKYVSTWKNAQHICRRYNNDLATIYNHNQAQNIYLKKYMAWIGLHREESNKDWVWTNGERHIVVWGHEQPNDNGDCAVIFYHDYNSRSVYSRSCERRQFFACQRSNTSSFHFIMEAKNWSEADTYCTDHYNGLARFKWHDMIYFSQQDIPTWIGLHRNGGSWKWSSGLEEYKQWNLAEPNNDKNCVAITSVNKRLTTQNCETLLPFLCMKDNLVLVKEKRSWEEAFEHCRSLGSSSNSGLHFNLLSVQPGYEHTYVKNKVMEADTEEVWTGLHYLSDEWLWVNGADMLYTDLPQCPILWQRCGALSKNDTGTMEARDCSEKNFLCYSYKP